MPRGNQSIVPYNQTVFTAVDGTTYKGQIDAATGVAQQMAGALYVYPNSPAGMSVLVDANFSFPIIGTGILASGLTQTVSIAAPVSGTKWSTVFLDLSNGVAGKIDAPINASATVPMNVGQIPLALVLVAAGASSITASNITDVRSFCVPRVATIVSPVSSNQNLACLGATVVSAQYVISANGLSFTLVNISIGVPVCITLQNGTGGSIVCSVGATDPTGTAYPTVNAVAAGGVGVSASIKPGVGSITLAAGTTRTLSAITVTNAIFFT